MVIYWFRLYNTMKAAGDIAARIKWSNPLPCQVSDVTLFKTRKGRHGVVLHVKR
jgi:hypothetical protein